VRPLLRRETPEVKEVTVVARRDRVLHGVEAVVNDGGVAQWNFEVELAAADGHEMDFGMRRINAREGLLTMVMERVDDGDAEVLRDFEPERRVDLHGVVPGAIA
jgi:hypothetical protein